MTRFLLSPRFPGIKAMKKILLFSFLLAAAVSYAQRAYLPYPVKRLAGQGTGRVGLIVDHVRDKEISIPIEGTLFTVGFTYEFPSPGRGKTGDVGIRCTGGRLENDGTLAKYRYRLGVHGSWAVDPDFLLTGAAGYGPFSLDGDTGTVYHYGLGISGYVQGMLAGVTLEAGKIDTAGGPVEFNGIEINAMEAPGIYWLKWYLGRVDGENLVRTDICFPLTFDDRGGGYALLIRYVNVNSHAPSSGAPPLASHGLLVGDWTEHEEWWIHLDMGLDRRRSDFLVHVAYGWYRTDAFEGRNDTTLMRLGVTYYF